MQIKGDTKVYGIFGKPVEHSFSPLIQNKAFEQAELNSVYVAFEPKSLKEAVKSVKNLNLQGLSVTIPFKIDVMNYLDEIDPLAENIGAVNTILNKDGRLIGFNTDGYGALRALEETESLDGKKVVMIGFGGAARAIAFTLLNTQAKEIVIWGFEEPAALSLVKELNAQQKVPVSFVKIDQETVLDYDILINTSPIGMWPKEDAMPLSEKQILKGKTVFDIVYRPKKTKLLQKAEEKGSKLVFGYKMLLYQGVKQFEIWTQKKAPVDAMQKVLVDYLNNQK